MTIFLVTIHIIASILLVILVLLQAGKGSSIGASFGGGANQALLGPAGSGNTMTKITTGLAIVFMVTSISLAYISGKTSSDSVMSNVKKSIPVSQDSSDSNSKVINKTDNDSKAE